MNYKKVLEAIKEVVEYTYEDEKEHWESENRPSEHIYHSLQVLKDYLETEK